MCGLNLTYRASLDVVRAMNEAIAQRGLPGRSRVTSMGPFQLGHVRLPIQGLTPEFDQPYQSGDSPYLVAFVGEVFNFRELLPGARSDVQLIAHDVGQTGLFDRRMNQAEYDGFWSIVVLDGRPAHQSAHIYVDYLAQKPLYIRREELSGRVLGVSSQILPLVLLDRVRPSPDPRYFAQVHKWGYPTGDRTIFEGIRALPPGSHTVIDRWGYAETQLLRGQRLEPAPADIREVVTRATLRRTISDVPIAMLLSGGLDSSIVYSILRSEGRITDDFTAFHVENGESEYLEHLDLSGVNVVHLPVEQADLEEALWTNEGPVDLGSLLPQHSLAKAIKKTCPTAHVVLTGDGADECFGGYRRMFEYDAQWSDVEEELVRYHLPRLDKVMMGQTLELRSPFLAKEVVEAALALPYIQRVDKAALKRAFEGLVPERILGRKKTPLRIRQMWDNPADWRRHLVRTFEERVLPMYANYRESVLR